MIKALRNIFISLVVLFLGANSFAFLFCSDVSAANIPDRSLTDAVVKIFVTSNPMDYYRPWQAQGIKGAGGTGVIIEGNRILTNAHVVSDHTFIQVKKDADPKRYTARVVAIGYDCDLALLEIDDPAFFKGIAPLKLGHLPKLRDAVTVIGYPQGGDKISMTEGVVSRVEVTSYAQSNRKLLTVQIDAAINPGNSGGPVVQDGKMVGVAMQVLRTGENIGYMIPVPIINHFLNDLKDDKYEGFPFLGIEFTNTENKALREFYGVGESVGGVFVKRVLPFSPAQKYLKSGDIIFEINGVSIGQDGTFLFRENERLSLTHLISKEQIGTTISLKIVRDHKIKEYHIPFSSFVPLIAPSHHFEKPSYFIFGGLVFTALSQDLVESWGNKWWEQSPLDFLFYLIGPGRLNEEENKELVILLNVLPDDINVGYHDEYNRIVTEVNGKEIKSFKDFVRRVSEDKDSKPYTVIETKQKSKIILSNQDIDAVTAKILKRNSIPAQFSNDVSSWVGNIKK